MSGFGTVAARAGLGARATVAGIILACVAASASAAEDCSQAGTTAEMVTCADAAFSKADAELNAVYRKVMDQLREADAAAGDGGDRAGKLRQAQRAWIALRNAQCKLEAAAVYGGTLASVVEIGCRADLTTARTKKLRSIATEF